MSEPSTLSFSQQLEADLSAAVDSAFAAEEQNSATSETPAVEATTTSETTVNAEPSAPAAAAPFSDETPIEVIVDGKPVQTTIGEAKRGYMRQAAFTQKTQEAAKQRQEAERQVQEAQQYRTWAQTEITNAAKFKADVMRMLSSPEQLSALYLNATGQAGSHPASQPTQTAPAFDPTKFRNDLLSEILPQVRQDVLSDIRQTQYETSQANDVTSFTDALIAENPILSVFGPDLAKVIYEKVASQGPGSMDEAKQFIRLHVDDYVSRLSEVNKDSGKAAAIAKHEATQGIQRGGSPVLPTKKDYNSFDDMQGDIEALVAQGL